MKEIVFQRCLLLSIGLQKEPRGSPAQCLSSGCLNYGIATPCDGSTLQTDYLKNRESSFSHLPSFVVIGVLSPSILEHGKQSRAIHLSPHPHLDPALGSCASFPAEARVCLSSRLKPLAFPRLTGDFLPCPVTWRPHQLLVFSLILHTCVSLVLFQQWRNFQMEDYQHCQFLCQQPTYHHYGTSMGWGEWQTGTHLRGECFGPENFCTKTGQVCHGG